MPNILHQVSVPVIDNPSCQDMFNSSGHKKTIRESFLCAGYKDGKKDSCEVCQSFIHSFIHSFNPSFHSTNIIILSSRVTVEAP